jgi:hypothetical protein
VARACLPEATGRAPLKGFAVEIDPQKVRCGVGSPPKPASRASTANHVVWGRPEGPLLLVSSWVQSGASGLPQITSFQRSDPSLAFNLGDCLRSCRPRIANEFSQSRHRLPQIRPGKEQLHPPCVRRIASPRKALVKRKFELDLTAAAAASIPARSAAAAIRTRQSRIPAGRPRKRVGLAFTRGTSSGPRGGRQVACRGGLARPSRLPTGAQFRGSGGIGQP